MCFIAPILKARFKERDKDCTLVDAHSRQSHLAAAEGSFGLMEKQHFFLHPPWVQEDRVWFSSNSSVKNTKRIKKAQCKGPYTEGFSKVLEFAWNFPIESDQVLRTGHRGGAPVLQTFQSHHGAQKSPKRSSPARGPVDAGCLRLDWEQRNCLRISTRSNESTWMRPWNKLKPLEIASSLWPKG